MGLLQEANDGGGEFTISRPNYEAKISYKDSWGARARQLWEAKFGEMAEIATNDSAFVYTGLGGAPGGNKSVEVRTFGDGSIVAPYYDLQETFGRVPKMLFLCAAPTSADHALNLAGLARTYKEEQGVNVVIAVMTGIPHEREDHQFIGKDGLPIRQVTTLKDVVKMLSTNIDGGLIVQPHSLRSVEFGFRYGFPLLPIDPFKLMMRRIQIVKGDVGVVMGPDKGRKDEGRMAASWLGWYMASAEKTRDREGDGTPKMYIPPEVLEFIRRKNLPVFIYDDELREGGTAGGLARALAGHARYIDLCIVKMICANKQKNGKFQTITDDLRPKTAVDHLGHDLIRHITTTDAVSPLLDLTPIQQKLDVIPLEPELQNLVRFLQGNFVNPGDPQWLRDPDKTRTLLRLDLSVEQI